MTTLVKKARAIKAKRNMRPYHPRTPATAKETMRRLYREQGNVASYTPDKM